MGRRYRSEVVRETRVRDRKIEIYCDNEGTFSARVCGEYFRTDTMKEILPKIRKAVEKSIIPIAVPVTLLGVQRKWQIVNCDAVVIGWNEAKSEFLIRFPDDTRDSVDESLGKRYSSGDAFIAKPLKGSDVATYVRLLKEKEAAETAFEAWKEKHQFDDLVAAVKQAQADAIDTPIETIENELDDDPRIAKPSRRKRRA